MMQKSRLGVVATLVALLHLSSTGLAAKIVVVDSHEASYLRAAADRQAASLDQHGVSALLSAIAGLLPPSTTSLKLSRVIDSILKPSPFVKPRACVVVNVAGLTADDVTSVFGGRNYQSVDIADLAGSNAASAVMQAVTAVASANPDVAVVPLEQMALLQDCGPHCLQEHVDALVTAVSAELIALDIARPGAERLFAVELANTLAGARAYLRDVEANAAQQAGEVVEVTLLGLHQLAVTYGAAAPQVAVAKAAVLDVLRLLVTGFDTAFGGDVVYQVSVLDSMPPRVGSMQELLSWKEGSRKQLLQLRGLQGTAFPGPNEAAMAKSFTIKAAAYGSFILLLYFSLAAVYCMCNMPFKADTMLFGRTKAE